MTKFENRTKGLQENRIYDKNWTKIEKYTKVENMSK